MTPTCFPRWQRAAVLALAVLSMTVGVLMVRSRTACSRGAAALSRGALDEAAVEFERAVGSYVPLDPAFRRAIEGMRAVAAGQEFSGDLLGAWRTSQRLQADIRETASIIPCDEALLGELGADQRRLESRLAASGTQVAGAVGPGAISANPYGSALVVFSFGAWLACMFALTTRVGGGRPPWLWLAASLAAWATWAVTLWLA